MDMIRALAKAPDSKAFRNRIPKSLDVLKGYIEKLKNRDVDLQDLIVKKRLSMHPDKYTHDVFQAIAARQLMEKGIEISGGQNVRYVITDAENKRASERVRAAELINAETRFDTEKYVEMLILTGTNILSPFDYTEEKIKNQLIYREKQTMLHINPAYGSPFRRT